MVSKCDCGLDSCKRCCEHKRYLKEKSLRLSRGRVKNLMIRNLKKDSNKLLDDFIDRKISLKDLELALEK